MIILNINLDNLLSNIEPISYRKFFAKINIRIFIFFSFVPKNVYSLY